LKQQALVVAISLITFVVPNIVGFGVWSLGDGLPTILRSLMAILGWVASFGLSAALFWRLVLVAFGNRVA
jgi:type II secretory pathway component PulF